jgi:hypothetical protein
MADFEAKYDAKAKNVTVSHANLFESVRKGYKDVLKVNPFQVLVEVAMETSVSDKDKLEEEAKKGAKGVEKDVLKELDDAANLLRKLQADEKKGNTKAATEADKAAKKAEKELKKYAAEFGIDVRKAVQKEYARQSGAKAQLRSINRTVFRGMELNEDAFECEAESSEALGDISQLAVKLATSGKEIAKLTQKEKELRRELASEVERVYQITESKRGKSGDFDIQEFAKQNPKDAKSLEGLANSYYVFVLEMDNACDDSLKYFGGIQKFVDKSDKLQDDKKLVKAMNEYGGGRKIVAEMLQDYYGAAENAKNLLTDSYGKGEDWKKLIANLNGLKGCTKSGKAMQDGASEIATLAKG